MDGFEFQPRLFARFAVFSANRAVFYGLELAFSDVSLWGHLRFRRTKSACGTTIAQ